MDIFGKFYLKSFYFIKFALVKFHAIISSTKEVIVLRNAIKFSKNVVIGVKDFAKIAQKTVDFVKKRYFPYHIVLLNPF